MRPFGDMSRRSAKPLIALIEGTPVRWDGVSLDANSDPKDVAARKRRDRGARRPVVAEVQVSCGHLHFGRIRRRALAERES
jgi:hypothetical protein